ATRSAWLARYVQPPEQAAGTGRIAARVHPSRAGQGAQAARVETPVPVPVPPPPRQAGPPSTPAASVARRRRRRRRPAAWPVPAWRPVALPFAGFRPVGLRAAARLHGPAARPPRCACARARPTRAPHRLRWPLGVAWRQTPVPLPQAWRRPLARPKRLPQAHPWPPPLPRV